MRALVLTYYALLRSIAQTRPELRVCRTRCRHCRIFFLTDPRNAGRHDLGCPFGCREAHRKAESTRRSTAYYRDEAGREKKRQLNARRRCCCSCEPAAGEAPPTTTSEAPPPWPRALLEYLCVVVSLIEGRPVGRAEILEMLARALRQHRMARRRPMDQFVERLHGKPP